ncbi:MAG: sigma-70 family RNA polymerase sigma factor [Pseudomonadota bacterium]
MLPRMRRFGMALTRRMDQADDLVQDACERAITRAEQFKPGTRFDSWVFSIMHSIWLNRLRSEKVRAAEGADALELVADAAAENRGEARVRLAELDRALLRLPQEQRAVIMLVSVEGHAYREAAEILDVPVGTVMSRLARARVALAEANRA